LLLDDLISVYRPWHFISKVLHSTSISTSPPKVRVHAAFMIIVVSFVNVPAAGLYFMVRI